MINDTPGTTLKLLLDTLGFNMVLSCANCAKTEEFMNTWGCSRCLEPNNFDLLVRHLKKNGQLWLKKNKLSLTEKSSIGIKLIQLKINPINPYEGLIKLAVTQTRRTI